VKVAFAVLKIVNEYASLDDAFPAAGAVPPENKTVCAPPSIVSAECLYAVTPFVTIKIIDSESPVASIEFRVAEPDPLTLRVQSLVVDPVKNNTP
jgi:hypothetical protein